MFRFKFDDCAPSSVLEFLVEASALASALAAGSVVDVNILFGGGGTIVAAALAAVAVVELATTLLE